MCVSIFVLSVRWSTLLICLQTCRSAKTKWVFINMCDAISQLLIYIIKRPTRQAWNLSEPVHTSHSGSCHLAHIQHIGVWLAVVLFIRMILAPNNLKQQRIFRVLLWLGFPWLILVICAAQGHQKYIWFKWEQVISLHVRSVTCCLSNFSFTFTSKMLS